MIACHHVGYITRLTWETTPAIHRYDATLTMQAVRQTVAFFHQGRRLDIMVSGVTYRFGNSKASQKRTSLQPDYAAPAGSAKAFAHRRLSKTVCKLMISLSVGWSINRQILLSLSISEFSEVLGRSCFHGRLVESFCSQRVRW